MSKPISFAQKQGDSKDDFNQPLEMPASEFSIGNFKIKLFEVDTVLLVVVIILVAILICCCLLYWCTCCWVSSEAKKA